jgi:hypothetical protein
MGNNTWSANGGWVYGTQSRQNEKIGVSKNQARA